MQLKRIGKYIGSVALVVLLASLKQTDADVREQSVKVAIRMIGDEFLLQVGDSTSRVMPVEKHQGRYLIQFENEFGFEPDFLSIAALKVAEKTKTLGSFILETEKCSTKEVVHSFEISSKKDESLVPCKARPLPKDCYKLYVTLLEEENPPVLAQKNIASTNFSFVYVIVIGLLLIGGVWYWKKRKNTAVTNSDWIQIGEYQFDKKGMKLFYKGKSEELSSKEASLLDLLYTNVNQTVSREHILQIVWEDEGDYLGRTLDVFISKLRKKLEADANLKIVNIRGVGYRIVLN
ncbi:MAG: response regulator transcription factor [Flavobacteriales bacterium]|nr:response regulator transcription factor [Flavobacteriales bacterium]MCW8914114.1 response regulator transcription factor [Flavobacteriales bacterium]MCW8938172.1 response regulator transcription factor [Flavobacteriales bacterium]MCW8940533.1 response regulator transcription factor [Flavobacteriales bacterium]MCW8968338.1 response regulator transcription factor [Flavobacteriales bacterium]